MQRIVNSAIVRSAVRSLVQPRIATTSAVLSQHRAASTSSCSSAGARRVVVVTGGAKGVGLGCVEAFVGDGNTLVVCLDTDRAALAAAASAHGPAIECRDVDVADAGACQALVADVWARHGRIDVLVNNAGIQVPGHPFPASVHQ